MAHLQRMAPVSPPPAICAMPLLNMQNQTIFYHEDTKRKEKNNCY
jgi:hypothetical protein